MNVDFDYYSLLLFIKENKKKQFLNFQITTFYVLITLVFTIDYK